MTDTLKRLSQAIELGKIDRASPYPPELEGQEGADELCLRALGEGFGPQEVLTEALVPAMSRVGEMYASGEVFVPEMLVAAGAMTAAMKHLKPYFASGEIKPKGTFVIGTVAGDLHDIGKNIVAMVVEGAGWKVVDLGVDVRTEAFLEAAARHPGCVVGMSALLTTTMTNMGAVVRALKARDAGTAVLVGGAPVTDAFRREIGADFYSRDPQGAVEFLKTLGGGA